MFQVTVAVAALPVKPVAGLPEVDFNQMNVRGSTDSYRFGTRSQSNSVS